MFPEKSSGDNASFPLQTSGGSGSSSANAYITTVSASIFTWPSSLCVSYEDTSHGI